MKALKQLLGKLAKAQSRLLIEAGDIKISPGKGLVLDHDDLDAIKVHRSDLVAIATAWRTRQGFPELPPLPVGKQVLATFPYPLRAACIRLAATLVDRGVHPHVADWIACVFMTDAWCDTLVAQHQPFVEQLKRLKALPMLILDAPCIHGPDHHVQAELQQELSDLLHYLDVNVP